MARGKGLDARALSEKGKEASRVLTKRGDVVLVEVSGPYREESA
jgi:hypothetical protein